MLEIYKESLSSILSIKKLSTVLIVLMFTVLISVLAYYNWHNIYPIFPISNVGTKFFGKTKDTAAANKNSSNKLNSSPIVSVFESKLKPVYSKATHVFVDSANVSADLIEVKRLDDGSLEAPHDWKVGGWYDNGARPGENGNLIINGHYDDNYGRPASFWSLKNVKLGDKVVVQDDFGKEYTYRVTDVYYVGIDDPDRTKIYDNDKDKAEITLITCGGVWVPGISNYNKRLIVKGGLEV